MEEEIIIPPSQTSILTQLKTQDTVAVISTKIREATPMAMEEIVTMAIAEATTKEVVATTTAGAEEDRMSPSLLTISRTIIILTQITSSKTSINSTPQMAMETTTTRINTDPIPTTKTITGVVVRATTVGARAMGKAISVGATTQEAAAIINMAAGEDTKINRIHTTKTTNVRAIIHHITPTSMEASKLK